MEPNEQDAQVDSSPANEVVTETQTDSSSQSTTISSSPQQDANQGAATPPPENVYGEVRRKLDELPNLVQSTVRDALSQYGQNTFQQPGASPQSEPKYKNYTRSQLEAILVHPDATDQDKMFANRGLGVIEAKEETLGEVRRETQAYETQNRQSQALRQVITDYPQVYNQATNTWNISDPLYQRAMQVYSSDRRFQQFGNEGFQAAMDRAYAQMAREGSINLNKQKVKVNAQARELQKMQAGVMTAGSQSAPIQTQEGQSAAKLSKLMEEWKKNPDDPRLRNEVFKAKGVIPKAWLQQ